MKSVRIYKDNIREHILRSLFFTDSVIAMSGALLISGLLLFFFHFVLHFFTWGYFLSSLLILEIFFIGFITQKVDNQPIYKILPRGITYKGAKKELRHQEMEPYFIDFTIQDNFIMRRNNIVKMFEVEAFDIALLNDEDREHFFMKLKQMIHVLPSQVQFIVRKEKAALSDFSKHFFSIYDQSNRKREPLIEQYVEDLSSLVDSHTFFTVRHYAVFSVPCDTSKPHEKVKAIKKLNDWGIRFTSTLTTCNIPARPLTNDELIQFTQSTLR